MKNLYLLFILSIFSFSAFSQSPSVYGTVLNQSSVAVAGQVVHLVDSSNGVQNYAAVDTTNANGEYSFSIPGNVPTGSGIHVRTEKCGMVYTNVYAYQGTNIVSNFVVCGTTTNNVSGTVKLGTATGNPAYPATVYLIHKTLNQTTNTYVLTLLDTTATNTNGEFQFSGITYGAGDLLVKAALTTANTNYANYLPTYKENALMWSSALAVSFTIGANNIHMVAGVNPGGPGFIAGSVLQGANKTTNVGDPLSNRLFLLTTINDVGVGYTFSDAGGHFSFSNLAYGTYKLFGDAWGKVNAIDTIIISANQPSVQVVFAENSTENIPTGIDHETAIQAIRISPNPFTNFIDISGIAETSGAVFCKLYNTVGICCVNQKIIASSNSLLTQNLSAGIYFLQLINSQGTLMKVIQLVKE